MHSHKSLALIVTTALSLLTACGSDQSGSPGVNGAQGLQGTPGLSGHSVVFKMTPSQSCAAGGTIILMGEDLNDNGVLDNTDGGIQSAVICNGVNGQDAPPTAFTPISAITPCGPHSSSYKEILLLLSDGSVLASFSANESGKDTRLALIPDGTFEDTDDSHCIFTISTSGSTRSISWSGGGQIWSI